MYPKSIDLFHSLLYFYLKKKANLILHFILLLHFIFYVFSFNHPTVKNSINIIYMIYICIILKGARLTLNLLQNWFIHSVKKKKKKKTKQKKQQYIINQFIWKINTFYNT